MKKRKVVALLMVSATIFSSVFSNCNLKTYAEEYEQNESFIKEFVEEKSAEEIKNGMIDTEEYDYISLNEDMQLKESEYLLEEAVDTDIFMQEAQAETSSEDESDILPSKIDLSTSEYFPEVGDQGSTGSCWHYGTIYACLTYANNKDRGIKTTAENTLNPIFGYNYASGTKNSSLDGLVQQIGYPTAGVLPIDTKNTLSLYPIKEVWESALRNRGGQYISYNVFGDEDNVVTGPDDSSIYLLKKKLSEGNPAAVSSYSYNWNYSVVASGEHKGELAVDRCDLNKTGGHIIAFVGYDDDIWVDINYDGEVQEAELGAFKMINSWGKDWGNDGFIWITYDSLNEESQVLTDEEETRINAAIDAGTIKANKVNNSVRRSFFMYKTFSNPVVRDRISSECLIYMTVNTGSRKQMSMTVTATKKTDGTVTSYDMPNYAGESGGKNLAWDGTAYSTDATMVFDLDNVISDISSDTMEDYTWEVTFGDNTLDEYSLVVKDLYFTVDGAKKYMTSVSKVPLNGITKKYTMNLRTKDFSLDSAIEEENKKNVVIYYNNSSYDDAFIHYKVGSGSWTTVPGVQMCKTDEQTGYTWKYVVNLGTASTMTACFNNGNGTWDNNNSNDYSITSAGCYGIKNGTITKLTEPENTIEPLIELDKTNISLFVGEEEVVTPTVIDGSVDDIVWSSSDEAVATVSSDGKVSAVGKGTATITAKIGEVSVSFEVTVEENQEPLAVALTVGGGAETLTKTVGSSIKLDAVASGGSGSYTYKFSVLNVETGVWTALQNFATGSSYTFALNYTGTKQFAVTVKDSEGTTVSSTRITVKVTNPETELKGTLKVKDSTEALTKTVGSKITLNAQATGGSGSYTYKFAVLNVDTGKWSALKDYSSTASYTYSLDYTGTKQFAVTVKDSNGKTVATNRITVNVVKETESLSAKLTVNGATGNVVAFVGDSINLSVATSGGSGSYTYKYVVYNVDTKAWFVLKDYNSSSSYTTKLSIAGTKQFVVSVKDSTGKIVSTERVTVSALN